MAQCKLKIRGSAHSAGTGLCRLGTGHWAGEADNCGAVVRSVADKHKLAHKQWRAQAASQMPTQRSRTASLGQRPITPYCCLSLHQLLSINQGTQAMAKAHAD